MKVVTDWRRLLATTSACTASRQVSKHVRKPTTSSICSYCGLFIPLSLDSVGEGIMFLNCPVVPFVRPVKMQMHTVQRLDST